MSSRDKTAPPRPVRAGSAEFRARRAAALRQNLRRRKAQATARREAAEKARQASGKQGADE